MDSMDDSEYASEWLTYAERDLNSAEFLTNQRPVPVEIICFLCQQCAEKSLKGLLITKDIMPPKIHDLRTLYDLCVPIIANINPLILACEVLNPYSSRTRYPNKLKITENDMKQALANAQTILQFAKPIIQG